MGDSTANKRAPALSSVLGRAPAGGGSTPQWGSRSVELFEKVEQVGEGTYGQVYKAKNKQTQEFVALKRVRMDNEKEGFPITAIREIKILKVLNHKNIVRLKEIVTSKGNPSEYNHGKGSIYMVMEFCDHDLTGLTDAGLRFSPAHIKCYMKQLLEGMAYCHKNRILHRDIKGSNLLINNEGQLKLADFGLARPFDDQQKTYTNRVITLWYRPPELLLGAQIYGPAIDMWSVGCIFAELLLRKPILPGRNEPEQLDCICKLLGTPTEQTWPGVSKLVHYDMFMSGKAVYQNRFQDKFGGLDRVAQDLLQKLLSMDPTKRISAKEALDHDYFWTDPLPAKPENLPKHPSSHEFTAKKRRQQLHQQQQQQHAQPQQQQSAQPYGSYPYPTSQGMQRPQPQSYGGGKRYRDGPTSYQERGAPPGAQHYMHQAQPPHHAQRYSSSARPPSAVPPGAHHLKGGVNPATGGAWPRSQ